VLAPLTALNVAATAPLRLDRVELRLLRLPLVAPFETSFGSVDSRLIFLVRIEAEGVSGWGEVVAMEAPLFSYETAATARHVIRDFFAPALLADPLSGLDELAARLGVFRGHPMARAGLEQAFVDLVARLQERSLSEVLGGSRDSVAVGVSLGIAARREALLEQVERHLALGYQRIKLKIKPGWDVDVVEAVRRRHPGTLLSVDANGAYRLADAEHLARLDAFDLLMLEQPLQHDDLLDHATLQKSIATSICLDESLTGLRQTEQALELESCRIVNMKVGRVGGYSQALPIHALCRERGVPLWCGGMLESGVGRAHNLALASLEGFVLPGDISASSRYFERDLIVPEVKVGADGTVAVPRGPGLGFDIDHDYVRARTEVVERFDRPGA
jgi:O-succinylbenzoate synthase